MISSIHLSEQSLTLLNRRQLNQAEILQFSELLIEAKSQQGSPKQSLLAMSAEELALLQKANSLADPINAGVLSEEGAANLLSQPDNSDKVDLNNDGFVEVGLAKLIIFPPVNAPDRVKVAWEKATTGMDEMDKAILELQMHIAVYGIQIEGVEQKVALSPEQQWSQSGIDKLFKSLRSNLEFRVNHEGWTPHNLMLKDFYEEFETALDSPFSHASEVDSTQVTAVEQTAEEKATQRSSDSDSKVHNELMQLLLDARLGLDRRKLDEIDEKIKAISNDSSLGSKQKKQLISALEKQKVAIIEEAQRRIVDEEKRKSLLSTNTNLLERLQAGNLKLVT